MSWGIHVNSPSGVPKDLALSEIARQVEAQRSYQNAKQIAIIEAAAAFLRTVVEGAPDGVTFDLSMSGHTDQDGFAGATAKVASLRPPAEA
jgi:hypothetical protein